MIEYEYLELGYRPKEDIVCLFRIEPANSLNLKKASNIVALESSTGTWTKELSTNKKYVKKLNAKVFSINGNLVKIAYPSELFEKGNAPNIFSSRKHTGHESSK